MITKSNVVLKNLTYDKLKKVPKASTRDVQLVSEASKAVVEWPPHDNHRPTVTTVQVHQYIHYDYNDQRVGSYDVIQ